MLYPLTFHPIFKERIWGGRSLERLYRKALPAGVPIGESWEISDRPGDESVVANGVLAGKSLRWLMEKHRGELLGRARPAADGRFPLLCKILDARDRLSLQVHPPDDRAGELGGEPKTEMWYIADAAPGAELFVGLKRGVTPAGFEARIRSGQVADCFHRVHAASGDTMFLPSGRVHAIGAGFVIFEIQQNSDTTYRVFDWNRAGLDGKPRDLHVPQSLRSIDFSDIEPSLVDAPVVDRGVLGTRALVRHPLFSADLCDARTRGASRFEEPLLRVVAAVAGHLTVTGAGVSLEVPPGGFCVVPSCVADAAVAFDDGCRFLVVGAGA
jgi:mannose-6-phosphate isomerase